MATATKKRVDFMPEVNKIQARRRRELAEAKDRYDAEVKAIDTLAIAELELIEKKCVEVNGNHLDAGGMFFATCKTCCWSDADGAF